MTASEHHDNILLGCLRLGTFLCFAGWAWQHLYWEAPYSALLWHDGTYAFAERLGIGWDEFVGTGADDGFVQKWVNRVGWLYVGCAVVSLTVSAKSWWQMAVLVIGSGLLVVVSYAKYLSSYCEPPMFVEHGGQMLMPIVLLLGLALGVRHRATVVVAVLALMATFVGHGSYALGWWPTPANFAAMVTVILRVDYERAKQLLWIAGVLDFVVCVGILIPFTRRSCVFYAATWGLLTALARPAAGMSTSLNYWAADQFVHEAVLRAPHFLIPLYLFLLWRKTAQDRSGDLDYTTHKSSNNKENP